MLFRSPAGRGVTVEFPAPAWFRPRRVRAVTPAGLAAGDELAADTAGWTLTLPAPAHANVYLLEE